MKCLHHPNYPPSRSVNQEGRIEALRSSELISSPAGSQNVDRIQATRVKLNHPPIPCLFQRFAALFLRPARQLIFPEYNDILFMRMTGFLVLLVDLMASSSHPTSSGAGLNYEDSPSLGSLRLCWTAFEHPEVILSGHIVGIH